MENGNNRDASPGDSPAIGRSRSRSHSHQRSRKQVSRSRSRSRSKEREHRRKKRGSESPKRSHHQNSNYYGSRGHQGEFRGGRYGGYQQYGGSRGYSSRGFGGRNYNSSYNEHNGYTHRESPPEGRCLGVFGLSVDTNEKKLRHYFEEFGGLEDIHLVYDAKTSRSRGFAFIYFENVNSAKHAKEKLNGIEIDGRKIRVDFSITQHAHTPTPGIYMGRHNSRSRSNYTSGHNSRYDHPRDFYESRDRYPVKRRFSRSKSRSPTRKGYHSYEDKPFRRSHYPSSGFKDDYSRY